MRAITDFSIPQQPPLSSFAATNNMLGERTLNNTLGCGYATKHATTPY
jgi:hypothetical protein